MQNLTTPFSACNASTIPYPIVFGAHILDLTATLVQNYTGAYDPATQSITPAALGLNFCNVTVTYTHKGQNDNINVETWLPIEDWNGRLQAVGGGGWVAGRFSISYVFMDEAISEGYVASTTDAGYGSAPIPDEWALNSPGNVDMYTLQNFASKSLHDQSLIAKDVTKSFYGRAAKFSYFNGCSQGGRQGLMLAQRYPTAYDGIVAGSPAINWNHLFFHTAWAQVLMSMTNQFPTKCELDAITSAVVAHCDPLDGVIDGIVSDTEKCFFDPFTMVGSVCNCTSTGKAITISEGAAFIANATWEGPRGPSGEFIWYGVDLASDLTGSDGLDGAPFRTALAATTCNANGICTGAPVFLGEAWLKFFVKKDPEWSYTQISSVEEYMRLFKSSLQEYESIIETADPDLSEYRKAGGKIMTFHGLADGIIPHKGTDDYYRRVMDLDANVDDFFRYFQVPGLGHCSGGVAGGKPPATFHALVDWVEKKVVPEILPVSFNNTKGMQYDRFLCPYPMKTRLVSKDADATKPEAYECAL
ncbi:putative feruloyl esterase [Alternaria gaisen]|uniref:Feruloyl esterase n=1 Tax=Alternaria gaisen TaxID=167740 RepID=A0ACB6FUH5_9PLEO|nr:putative feruloyl esterase [Alternaria gaisen]